MMRKFLLFGTVTGLLAGCGGGGGTSAPPMELNVLTFTSPSADYNSSSAEIRSGDVRTTAAPWTIFYGVPERGVTIGVYSGTLSPPVTLPSSDVTVTYSETEGSKLYRATSGTVEQNREGFVFRNVVLEADPRTSARGRVTLNGLFRG